MVLFSVKSKNMIFNYDTVTKNNWRNMQNIPVRGVFRTQSRFLVGTIENR